MFSGRGLCNWPIPRPGESYRVCVSLIVIRCNNNPTYLRGVGRRRYTKKERKKERSKQTNESCMNVWFLPCLLHVPPVSLSLIQSQIMIKLWQTFYAFLYGSYAFSQEINRISICKKLNYHIEFQSLLVCLVGS